MISRALRSARRSDSTLLPRVPQPDRITPIEKRRRRWRIPYQGKDFAVNLDELLDHQSPGPYIEIKSRTWSRRDATEKAELIGELLRHFGVNELALIKQEYAEL